MALFGSKKNTEIKAVKPVRNTSKEIAIVEKTRPVSDGSAGISNIAGAILRPRITEKSGLLSQGGVYTFEVTKSSTKASISRAVTALYKVIPVKVAIVNLPARKVFVKGRRGVVAGVRKALVTVKKGDKIDFV